MSEGYADSLYETHRASVERERKRWEIKEPTSVDHITSYEYMNYYASNGMVDRVSQVLKMDNGYVWEALSLAAKNDQLEVVKLLLESGFPSESHIRKASSDAAIAGHLETFKLLFNQDGAFDSGILNCRQSWVLPSFSPIALTGGSRRRCRSAPCRTAARRSAP